MEVDNGVAFRNTYGPDGKSLHWEAVAGPTTGQAETVDLLVAEITPHVCFVSWTKASTGMTVSQVMNLHTNIVHALWTYETDGGRVGELHTGSLPPVWSLSAPASSAVLAATAHQRSSPSPERHDAPTTGKEER